MTPRYIEMEQNLKKCLRANAKLNKKVSLIVKMQFEQALSIIVDAQNFGWFPILRTFFPSNQYTCYATCV